MGKVKPRRSVGARTFIREWRKKNKLTLERLAEEIGVTAGAISQLERGQVQYTQPMLEALAAALHCSPSDLISRSPDMLVPDDGAEPTEEHPFGVRYGGIVEAGTFRSDDGLNQDDTYRYIQMAPDRRYPLDSQFAFQVIGDSMEKAGIVDGMWVLAVDIYTWERLHGLPRDGALVIVARTRDGHPERELTVKRLRIFMDRYELQPESGNPTHKPIVSALPLKEHTEEWSVQAIVISATWLFV